MSVNLQQKIIDLETSLGLLQHDFDKQNEMLLITQRRVDVLENAVARLTSFVESVRLDPARTPADDKPPHY